jgi:glycosyltransferase involved in cell wall biosynthesis
MLTLITATLNAARYIEQAFASVPQTPGIQHIVVDGGSVDATVEISRAQKSVEVVEAPGCSIYDAWNIGIERSRTEWIMLLNADDELDDDVFEILTTASTKHAGAEIIAGQALMIDRDAPGASPLVLNAAPSGSLDVEQLALGVPAINAMAFQRSLFVRYGGFDPTYRIAGDRAFLLRLAMRSPAITVGRVDRILYRYYSHAGSLTLKRGFEQRMRIARDHLLLTTQLLTEEPTRQTAHVLRYWRRREAAVAALRCAAAGRPVEAVHFVGQLLARHDAR